MIMFMLYIYQEKSGDHHPLSHRLVRLSVALSSLHVHDEVAHIKRHLRRRGRSPYFI